MVIEKQKITAALGSFLFAIFLLAAYFITHTVPLTRLYLGSDRLNHAAIVFAFFLLAGFFYYLGQKKTRATLIFYLLALLCAAAIPLVLLIGYSSSFRGFEWAIETLLIGWGPVLFLLFGYLILMGKHLISLLVVVCCTFFALYHMVLFIRIVPRLGKAFSSASDRDIIILLSITLFSFLCALANLKYFLASRK
jgi:hypothetical protein